MPRRIYTCILLIVSSENKKGILIRLEFSITAKHEGRLLFVFFFFFFFRFKSIEEEEANLLIDLISSNSQRLKRFNQRHGRHKSKETRGKLTMMVMFLPQ